MASKLNIIDIKFWQTHDGFGLEAIDGTGVFLGVFEAAVTEAAGDSLDVGAIIEDVDGKRMAGAVPGDMLVDSGRFNPAVDRLEAHGVRRQLEQERIEVLILGWLADETDDFIRKRNDHAGVGRVTFGLVLLELK